MVTHDPDTTRLIDQLVKADLVRRSRSTEDRRCVCVSITPEGRRLLHRVKKKVHDLHRRQLGHLGRKQLEQLSRLLFLVRHP
jgi:DNA-binding MarR family transcriptional regulator